MGQKTATLTASVVVATLGLLVPSITQAQRGSFGAAGARSAVPVRLAAPAPRMPSSGIRVNSRGGVNRPASANHGSQDAFGVNGVNGFNSFSGGPLSFQDLLGLTPSNGFNYQFVNAINQDLPIKAFIDPVTQIEVAQAERLLRSTGGAFGGGGFIWGGGGGGYYYPPESEEGEQQQPAQTAETQPQQNPQPQIIVLQQAPQQQSAQSNAPAPAPEEEQVRDEGNFTLVLRNGKQVDAVAFTRSNDKIIYITPGGGRLTIAMADLDTDATIRINQERGTPFQLPL